MERPVLQESRRPLHVEIFERGGIDAAPGRSDRPEKRPHFFPASGVSPRDLSDDGADRRVLYPPDEAQFRRRIAGVSAEGHPLDFSRHLERKGGCRVGRCGGDEQVEDDRRHEEESDFRDSALWQFEKIAAFRRMFRHDGKKL
eukprot:CAMPEP_0194331648 /NCGR_PEP_ID=MMETSP0171-20130528/56326_1 /TAXON_ID=218684 /ORGANISM="Corethron pennatum, Strain L29A3" /LENGTH=142 /DNA_ID=CAMNT_0039093191 /DNA_START=373 /DNA_END=798 /DNA_ORIENTATION=+